MFKGTLGDVDGVPLTKAAHSTFLIEARAEKEYIFLDCHPKCGQNELRQTQHRRATQQQAMPKVQGKMGLGEGTRRQSALENRHGYCWTRH